MTECDICGTSELAYELETGRGGVNVRCLTCLAIERGNAEFSLSFERFIDNDEWQDGPPFDSQEEWDEHRRLKYEAARDWFTILGRIQQDDPILKRDTDELGRTVHEHRRTFLTNILGSAAYHSPSEIIESDGDPGQTTLGDSS